MKMEGKVKKCFFSLIFLFVTFSFFSQDFERQLSVFESSMTVYGDRIAIEEREVSSTPAQVVVLTQEDIKKTGVQTLAKLLENIVSSLGKDLTGNPIQRSVDLRGFPQGTDVVVFLNGVKLNNIVDNSVDLELIPVNIIDRVEVYSGALAPFYGGGAIGGVINIITKKGEAIPRIDLTAASGKFDTFDRDLSFSGSKDNFSLFSSLSLQNSQGYRENDGYQLKNGVINFNYKEGKDELSFLAKYEEETISAPGALTEEEMKIDRKQSPFNQYDNTRGRHKIYAFTYLRKFDENNSLSFEIIRRERGNDILTTGRFLSGFQTHSKEFLNEFIGEYDSKIHLNRGILNISASAEYSNGKNSSQGFYTDFFGNEISRATSNKVKEKLFGGFFNLSYILPRWKFDAGARVDSSKYEYEDFLLLKNNTNRSFNENCKRVSVMHFISQENSIFLAFSEGYKIPSVTDLFSYPGFYSNPDLKPSRVNDYEAGYKFVGESSRIKITLYKMYLRDEAVFVLTNPILFIGMNENIGKSKREGIETNLSFDLKNDFELELNGTLRKSKVTKGPYEEKEIPMTPKTICSAFITKRIEKFLVNLGLRYVSSQYLDNDLENVREKLSSYSLMSINLRYQKGHLIYDFLVENVLDRKYSTRGVTNGKENFYLPAYPLNAKFSVTYSF